MKLAVDISVFVICILTQVYLTKGILSTDMMPIHDVLVGQFLIVIVLFLIGFQNAMRNK